MLAATLPEASPLHASPVRTCYPRGFIITPPQKSTSVDDKLYGRHINSNDKSSVKPEQLSWCFPEVILFCGFQVIRTVLPDAFSGQRCELS